MKDEMLCTLVCPPEGQSSCSKSSPAVRWCTGTGTRANVAAKWRVNRRTARTCTVRTHIVNPWTDAMMPGRSRCWQGDAENNRGEKRNRSTRGPRELGRNAPFALAMLQRLGRENIPALAGTVTLCGQAAPRTTKSGAAIAIQIRACHDTFLARCLTAMACPAKQRVSQNSRRVCGSRT